MHPELEDFLETAFNPVQQTVPGIGHVEIEPDYNVAPDEQERAPLRRELSEALQDSSVPGEVAISDRFPLLKKYVRRISLHREPIPGAWVEVAPPGNWI
jgi:hypothetical protein